MSTISTNGPLTEKQLGDWVRQALNENARWMLVIQAKSSYGTPFYCYAKSFKFAEYDACLAYIDSRLEPTSPEADMEKVVVVCDLGKLTTFSQQGHDIEKAIEQLKAARGMPISQVQVGEG